MMSKFLKTAYKATKAPVKNSILKIKTNSMY